MKKSKVIVIIVAALTLLTWGTSTFMEYRERSLDSIIPLQPSQFVSILYTDDLTTLTNDDLKLYITEDPEAVYELLEFLHGYDVKKQWWQGSNDTDDDIIASFTITHENIRPVTIILHEDYMRTGSGKRNKYNIVNGPIDRDWLASWEEFFID